MKKNNKASHLQDTLQQLQSALIDWDKIPTTSETEEMTEFKRKTRDLLKKLTDQIKDFDL